MIGDAGKNRVHQLKSLKENTMIRHTFVAVVSSLALMLGAAAPGWAQHFQQVPNAILFQVAPGAVSAWGMTTCQPDCFMNSIDQYVAGQFRQVSSPTEFASVGVGGGSVMQFDEVWATDVNNLIYQWDNYGQTFHQVAGSLQNVVVGEGYSACHPYEVWGSDVNHQVWRFNYCTHSFDFIGGFFNGLSTGGGEVWALNGYNQVFRFNFSTNQFDLMPGSLTQISVGAGGVWGTSYSVAGSSIWQFDPSAQSWQQLPGPMDEIVAGADGVFGSFNSYQNGPNAYRLNPSTRTWTLVQSGSGSFSPIGSMAVGTGAGTWLTGQTEQPTYYYLSF
jgi:hypothetical protein